MNAQLELVHPGDVECELDFTVDNVWHGSVRRPYSWQSGSGGWCVRQSAAYVCPRCLKLWAILRCSKEPTFSIWRHSCRNCPPTTGEVPGSLSVSMYFLQQDPLLLDYLPPALLKREFELHLKHYEGAQA